ncbi:bifunctional acetate--CoA ligase family protein/GNAT family N-acetyltransferase [Chloroflexia bacterium SDU3-3]|nr:bifunctional acetate--CoA ligase family protein/GNAT family N-acetyltransferase [Chloroflexia bacterium SDU3-3]
MVSAMTDDTEYQPTPYAIDVFTAPRAIAVIGATEEPHSFGRTALWNLISSPFGGTVYPIHPTRSSVLGIKAYPHVNAAPEQIDLAIIVTPTSTVPALVRECAQARVKGAIIVTSGFRALGASGVALEQQALAEARKTGMRLMGPNSLGLIHSQGHLNASCARAMPKPGNLAFISHSAALATAVLDWSLQENIGFSHFISLGSMLDIGWGDMIDYLGSDPSTDSIVIYMESVGDARAFLSAAREVALAKPIVVLKAGRSEQAARSLAAHTGSQIERDEIFDAALRRCGVLRVASIAEMFAMADALARQPRPRGPRLSIITNAGGPGILAADTLIASHGALATLSSATIEQLDQILPTAWAESNPVDLQGDAKAPRYAAAIDIVGRDPQVDGLLVILNPTLMSEPDETAQQLSRYAHTIGKPLLASWMGGDMIANGARQLKQAGIPVYAYPDVAARTFSYMWQYSENLRSLYETPALPSSSPINRARICEIFEQADREQRTLLLEIESKHVLEAYGIPVCPTFAASSPAQAVALAETLGYPVVMKLQGAEIAHKSDLGGVRLNLQTSEQVSATFYELIATAQQHSLTSYTVSIQPMVQGRGYELIIGSIADPQFGPALLFGAGGDLVEIHQDRAFGLPPLNTTLARRMMEQTRIFHALPGVRGRPAVDSAKLEHLMVQFSQLVIEQPRIRAIDINPLYIDSTTIAALDARITLYPPTSSLEQLPKVAIRPYPAEYISRHQLRDGSTVLIRPIRPEDEPLMIGFHQSLSEQSIYYRFFRSMSYDRRIEHERLSRVCFLDYDRELALVAIRQPADSGSEVIGVGRLTHPRRLEDAEFALLVSDSVQGKGLGKILLGQLVDIARKEQFQRLVGYMLPENRGMIHIAEQLGFRIKRSLDITEATLVL